MPGDDDERASEAERLVLELAEVRKRMQMRAEQPSRRNGSGSYRSVTPLPFMIAAAKAAEPRPTTPAPEPATEPAPEAERPTDDDAPPPTRRRPG